MGIFFFVLGMEYARWVNLEDDMDIHAFGSTSLHSGRKSQTDGKWGNSYGTIDISGTQSYAYVKDE